MNTTTLIMDRAAKSAWVARLHDYFELTKPRIATLVLVTVAVAAIVASWGQPDPTLLFHAVFATALIASSASIWNQWIERDTDAMMERTAGRPVPTGRVTRWEIHALGAATLLIGFAELMICVNTTSALLGLATWVLYVLVYTPLKRVTSWNTLVGAIPGAMPILIGWTAMGQSIDLRGWSLFFIVFLWQFPHFMAIAWKYRHQYGDAGIKMITVVDGTGRRAGIQAVVGALALLPVSLIPALMAPPSPAYAVVAFLLGLGQLALAIRFFLRRDLLSARLLLRASLVYLPVVMLGLATIPLIS